MNEVSSPLCVVIRAFLITATDSRNASTSTSVPFVINSLSPIKVGPISDTVATVGEKFSHAISPFVDLNGDSINYTIRGLPGWLNSSIDDNTIRFSGTPGHGDTDTYRARILSIQITASDSYNESVTTAFNINVEGNSYIALAIAIGTPILSTLTAIYTAYKYRHWIENVRRKNYYNKPMKTVKIGQKFMYRIECSRSKIKKIRVFIVNDKNELEDLPEDINLPYWMEYDHYHRILRSRAEVPEECESKLLIQILGKDHIIEEQFILSVTDKDDEKSMISLPLLSTDRSINDSKY